MLNARRCSKGKAKLAEGVASQAEISFVALYKNQPSLGDVDLELRSQGFLPQCFGDQVWPIAPALVDNNPHQALNQLLDTDIVYVSDFAHADSMSEEQLKHLAPIVHYCYRSFDPALRCVMLLEQRGAAAADVEHDVESADFKPVETFKTSRHEPNLEC